MYLYNLRLYDFRNFSELNTKFNNGINIFYGDNAQGKTNLLEAIYFISELRAARAFKESELIKYERPLAFIKGEFKTNTGPITRQVTFYRDRKKEVKEGENKKNKRSDLCPDISAVYFSPDDVNLIKGEPGLRRRFIDNIVCQFRPTFYKYLQDYQRVLAERNMLLKSIKVKPELIKTLDPWDNQLIEFGFRVISERISMLSKISQKAKDYFKSFSPPESHLDIKYKSEIDFTNLSLIKKDYSKKLIENRKKDIGRSFTSLGPHRDDIEFLINGRDAKYFASQGQQRLITLCLKFAQRSLLSTEKGEFPILLLDDVMSELDEGHRKLILDDEKSQVFITTTDLKFIPDNILKKASLYLINNGRIGEQDGKN